MTTKIACCISGYPSLRILEYLTCFTKYKGMMDFFIFFWDVINEQLKQKINQLLQPKEILYQKLINFKFDAKFKEPDKPDSKNNAISMFYGISQVQKLRFMFEKKQRKKYDIVFRCRYDIHFFDDLSMILWNVSKKTDANNIIIPWERHHIGICDQLWFGK